MSLWNVLIFHVSLVHQASELSKRVGVARLVYLPTVLAQVFTDPFVMRMVMFTEIDAKQSA